MAESKVEHLLDSIHFPEDLRHLSQDKLEQVCADLRQYIINVLSENPGHLGASLGTVELTVALHYVFNTPYDRAPMTLLSPDTPQIQSLRRWVCR